MDIQTTKLNLIQWLAGLQDAVLIQALAEFKKEAEKDSFKTQFPKLTKEDLIERALASEAAFKNGEYVDIESLEKENW